MTLRSRQAEQPLRIELHPEGAPPPSAAQGERV